MCSWGPLGLLDFGGGGGYARGLRFFAGLVGNSNECGSRMGQSPEYKAVDLFCGAGGLSLGLHWAGWNVELAVEQNAAASATYRHNFPSTMFLEKDVREVCFSGYKGIDLVAGGPPCQPFSVAGEQLAENDPRDMVPAFVRVVRETRPKSFLMENVPGLLTTKHKTYTSSVVRMFQSLDYVDGWRPAACR
ncbi:DNA cytosine methyltransferase [Myxococcota bacterium]|nr:DNA cytosine methyltransferase [Myxococcota bacterium]